MLFAFAFISIESIHGGWPLVAPPVPVGDGANGGTPCATCTLLVAIVSQTSQLYQESPEYVFDYTKKTYTLTQL